MQKEKTKNSFIIGGKMKKLITIILTLCMCFTLGISLTACNPEHTHAYTKTIATEDYLKSEATCLSKATYYKSCECGEKGTETFEHGDFAEHDFSLTWTKENGKHWHACQTEGCLVTSNEEVHSYLNGECVCGELEPVVDINEVSLTQWESAFEFENVTINQYLVISQGENVLVKTYLLDDSNAAMSFEGNTIPMEGYADFIRMNFDFSNCYTFAEYQEGKYFIDSFDVYGDGSYVYEDAYLTFENGVLKSITATIKEEVPEYDNDHNIIGSTVETSSCFIEFVDYGTTTITTVGNTLPITQEEWEALFAIENFDNMTIIASFSVGNTAYEENIYYNNGNEKITVTGYDNVELYCINSTWYTYYVSENTFVETDVFGAEYPYVSLSDSFKNFFSMMKISYAVINYDATEDTYYYIFDSASFYITVNNGKVACLSTIFNIEGETSVYSYTISNYGTTSFSVPFDPTHV